LRKKEREMAAKNGTIGKKEPKEENFSVAPEERQTTVEGLLESPRPLKEDDHTSKDGLQPTKKRVL